MPRCSHEGLLSSFWPSPITEAIVKSREASSSRSTRAPWLAVFLVAAAGCGKLTGPGIFSMGPQTASGSSAPTEEPTCHLNPNGTETCGYDCKLSPGDGHVCAQTPEGTCDMRGSEVVCTDPQPAPAPRTAEAPPPPSPVTAPAPQSDSSFSARCCVNGAYYDCPSSEDLSICIGEPGRLMSCISGCGMSSSCDDQCLNDHGPRPGASSCSREPSRDGECQK